MASSSTSSRERIKVVVRVRPFSDKEKAAGESCVVAMPSARATRLIDPVLMSARMAAATSQLSAAQVHHVCGRVLTRDGFGRDSARDAQAHRSIITHDRAGMRRLAIRNQKHNLQPTPQPNPLTTTANTTTTTTTSRLTHPRDRN